MAGGLSVLDDELPSGGVGLRGKTLSRSGGRALSGEGPSTSLLLGDGHRYPIGDCSILEKRDRCGCELHVSQMRLDKVPQSSVRDTEVAR